MQEHSYDMDASAFQPLTVHIDEALTISYHNRKKPKLQAFSAKLRERIKVHVMTLLCI